MTSIVRAKKDTSHPYSGIVEQPPGRIERVALNLWDIELQLQLDLRIDGSLIFFELKMTGSRELVRANQFGSSEADGASPIPGWSQKLPAQAAERLLGHNLTRPFTTKCSLSSHFDLQTQA